MTSETFEHILKGKYPAKSHTQRTIQRLRDDGVDANGILYFESSKAKLQVDNDFPEHFR